MNVFSFSFVCTSVTDACLASLTKPTQVGLLIYQLLFFFVTWLVGVVLPHIGRQRVFLAATPLAALLVCRIGMGRDPLVSTGSGRAHVIAKALTPVEVREGHPGARSGNRTCRHFNRHCFFLAVAATLWRAVPLILLVFIEFLLGRGAKSVLYFLHSG